MKARSFVLAGCVFLLGAAFTVQAQDQATPVIKVLPTPEEDVIKLLVAQNDGSAVSVRFHSDQGSISDDLISGKRAGSGFLKRYNFEKLEEDVFWMTIKTETTSSIYKITRSEEGVDARLEETTHTFPVVASR